MIGTCISSSSRRAVVSLRLRPPPCPRCSNLLGTACCEVRDDEQLATLTWADVERIRVAARLPAAAFSEEEWVTEKQATEYERRRPLYRGYFRSGTSRLTLRRQRGACTFLHPRIGCTLSPNVRPT